MNLLRKLARWVLKDELSKLRSSAVANQMKLDALWAAGSRLEAASRGWPVVSVSTVEWTDLRDALEQVRKLPQKAP